MFELLRMLILGKAIVLSAGGADINAAPAVFPAREPLVAINRGAHVSISVAHVVPVTDANSTLNRIQAIFPEGCIRAQGIKPDGTLIPLRHQGASVSADDAFIDLSEEGGANLQTAFTAIRIQSCRAIPQASVKWHNFQE